MTKTLLIGCLFVGSVAAAQGTRGLTGTITMTLQPPALGSSTQASSSFSGTVSLVSGKGRVDLTRAAGPAMDFRPGDYLLLLDSARVAYVRPSTQEYWNMDSPFLSPWGPLAAMAGQISAAGGTSALERLGDGDTVASFPTRRFRINSEYSVTAGEMRLPAGVTIELTVARTPVKFAAAPIAGAQTFGMATPAGLTSRIAGHLAEVAAEGTVIRSTSTTWFTPPNASVSLVITTELSELREADVDAAKLAMPAGYRSGG